MDKTSRPPIQRRNSGFTQAASLVQPRIREASEQRGFAVARLLTHWAEIAGPQLSRMAQPVSVTYGREGFGATLTLLTTGPQAPLVEMQKDVLRERVNACYGYRAIARIRITQTSAEALAPGFAETQVPFAAPARPSPELQARAEAVAAPVQDTELRFALAALAANVLGKRKP